jgi:hypothetical protein
MTGLLFSLLMMAGPPPGASPQPNGLARSLAEAERGFAASAADCGIRDAFLSVLAEDAVVFRPGPVNATQWFAGQPPTLGILSWQPALVETSRDGRLGFTTGPWDYRRDSTDVEPVAFGDYVSIWRHDAAQHPPAWKLLLDLGINHARPDSPETETRFAGGSLQSVPDVLIICIDSEPARKNLLARERAFSQAATRRGLRAAYLDFATEDIRVLREGTLPLAGRSAIRSALGDSLARVTWSTRDAAISYFRDFGYSWGELRPLAAPKTISSASTATREDTAATGYFARIWRQSEPDFIWRIALDIQIDASR